MCDTTGFISDANVSREAKFKKKKNTAISNYSWKKKDIQVQATLSYS